MRVLALETSTLIGSVAVSENGNILAEHSSERQNSHSEIINTYVDLCLKDAQVNLSNIDLFAVGIGPGSFTGIRVALNAGKTFSYAFQKPIVGFDSLYLLALQAGKTTTPVLSIINAYKNMVYYGLFDVSGDLPKFLKGPGVIPVKNLANIVQQEMLVVGDGFNAYQSFLAKDLLSKMSRSDHPLDYPLASTLAKVAATAKNNATTLDWKSIVPLYIRASEAEENKRGIVLIPL